MLNKAQEEEILSALKIVPAVFRDIPLNIIETYVEMRTAENLLERIKEHTDINSARSIISGYAEGTRAFLKGYLNYDFKE